MQAWVPYNSGCHRSVRAYAGEWTARAVHLRWHTPTATEDAWVWANAVRPIEENSAARQDIRPPIQGEPSADRPNLVARRSR